MAKCKFCKDFKAEEEDITIVEIMVGMAGYFGYICPLIYCPNCGERVKVKEAEKSCNNCKHFDTQFISCLYGRLCTNWEGRNG